MDIFFQDPDDIPLPPNEVRIREFSATPYPDGHRIRVFIEVTPFQRKPSGEIAIVNGTGREVASASIIETVTKRMELTMHLRDAETGGAYTATAEIFYGESPAEDANGSDKTYELPQRIIVDSTEITFSIPSPA